MLLQMVIFYSFLWLSNIPLCVCVCVCVCVYVCVCVCVYTYTHHIFFTHSSVDGQLGCFHILVQLQIMQLWTLGCMYLIKFICFFRYIPRSKIGVATVENGHFSKLKVELLKSTSLSVLKKKDTYIEREAKGWSQGEDWDKVRDKVIRRLLQLSWQEMKEAEEQGWEVAKFSMHSKDGVMLLLLSHFSRVRLCATP